MLSKSKAEYTPQGAHRAERIFVLSSAVIICVHMCDQHAFFFKFDKAFTHQLIQKFEVSPSHPLSEDVAPPTKGVYALYRKGKIVYAGKALDTTLKRRLAEHTRKIGDEGILNWAK